MSFPRDLSPSINHWYGSKMAYHDWVLLGEERDSDTIRGAYISDGLLTVQLKEWMLNFMLANNGNNKHFDYIDHYFGDETCIRILIKYGWTKETVTILRRYTMDERLPYIRFVKGIQAGEGFTVQLNPFCANEDWTRELMSYIGGIDENIRLF